MDIFDLSQTSFKQKFIDAGKGCEHLFFSYSLLALSGNAIFIFINPHLINEDYHDGFFLRIISILSLIGLLSLSVIDKYCKIPKSFYYLFWMTTVVISQPFFFSYMLYKNNFDYLWSLNALISTGFVLIIFDWILAFILIFLGIFAGVLLFVFTVENVTYSPNFPMFLSSFACLLIYGALFSYRRKTQEEIEISLQNLKFQSGAIAHEMRTPLSTIHMIGQALKNSFGAARRKQETASQSVAFNDKEMAKLEALANNLQATSNAAQTFIDLMLTNLKQNLDQVPLSRLSMKESVENTLKNYPFNGEEKTLVYLQVDSDFTFSGNEELFKHVLFNLLKNSLYFIHASGKGEIYIRISFDHNQNKVTFKDTGPGIPATQLSRIFKPFDSARPHGTGIGLAFCKRAIEGFGGKITVDSIFGESTTFTLSFKRDILE